MIDNTLVDTSSSPEDTLEHILFNTQTIAREHTQFKNCLKKSVKTFLENEIKITQHQIDSRATPTPSLDIYLANLKEQLSEHLEMDAAETKFKYKLSDFSNPQSPSKEFNANPPRSSSAFTEVFSINDRNVLITSREGTEKEIYKFYKQLYNHVETSGTIENFLQADTPKVTDQENLLLTKQISQTEIENFFKKSSPNKAPGITGLTSAFYKCFWPKLNKL